MAQRLLRTDTSCSTQRLLPNMLPPRSAYEGSGKGTGHRRVSPESSCGRSSKGPWLDPSRILIWREPLRVAPTNSRTRPVCGPLVPSGSSLLANYGFVATTHRVLLALSDLRSSLRLSPRLRSNTLEVSQQSGQRPLHRLL